MATYYRDIRATSEINDIGLDTDERQKYAFNIMAVSRTSVNFERELAQVIIDAGITGFDAIGTGIYASSKSNVPTGAGPYCSIHATGGPAPLATQENPVAYRRRTAEIVIRATNTHTARARAEATYAALTAVANQELDEAALP